MGLEACKRRTDTVKNVSGKYSKGTDVEEEKADEDTFRALIDRKSKRVLVDGIEFPSSRYNAI